MDITWEDGFLIGAHIQDGEVVVSANREGLVSLAGILMALAQEVPGAHGHLDEYNALEDSSCELVFERVD